MKKLIALFAIALMFVSTSMDADAAMRFGGGRSFGRSSSSLFQKAPAAKPSLAGKSTTQGATRATPNRPGATQSAKTGTAAAAASPARGLLMGAAAALGIAALVSALGLSEGFAQVLMMILIALVVYYALRFVMGLLLGAKARNTTYRGASPSYKKAAYEEPQRQSSAYAEGMASEAARPGSVMDSFSKEALPALSIPAGFDTEAFEKVARENFIQLQKAWDKCDIESVADFMTDDFFIALTHQMREHGAQKQTSEVVNLSTRLLGIVEEQGEYVAVVEFEGAMQISGQFEEVHERWLLVRAADDSTGWLLAGIEQTE